MECDLCGDVVEQRKDFCPDCNKKQEDANLLRIRECRKKLQTSKAACTAIQQKISSSLPKVDKDKDAELRLAASLSAIRNRTATTVSNYEADAVLIRKAKKRMSRQKSELDQLHRQIEAVKAYLSSNSIESEIATIAKKKKEVIDEIVHRRRALIGELLSFFPLNPSPNVESESIIGNLILPNNGNYQAVPPSILAAALGHVAHLCYLLSAYLDVFLPHPLEFGGSRSAIWTERAGTRHPLYGNRVSDSDSGLQLLNQDIVYLCATQGVRVQKANHTHTLLNLLALIRAPNLGHVEPLKWEPHQKSRRKSNVLRANSLANLPPTPDDPASDHAQPLDDEFIVVDPFAPPPSDFDALASYERALFIDAHT